MFKKKTALKATTKKQTATTKTAVKEKTLQPKLPKIEENKIIKNVAKKKPKPVEKTSHENAGEKSVSFKTTKNIEILLESGTSVSFPEGTSYARGSADLEILKMILAEREKNSDKIAN